MSPHLNREPTSDLPSERVIAAQWSINYSQNSRMLKGVFPAKLIRNHGIKSQKKQHGTVSARADVNSPTSVLKRYQKKQRGTGSDLVMTGAYW